MAAASSPGPHKTFPQSGVDLPDIAFGAQTTLAYSENAAGTGGTLTVSDGRHAAAIALLGNYMAGSFVVVGRRPWRHAGHRGVTSGAAAAGASASDLNGGGLRSGQARELPYAASSMERRPLLGGQFHTSPGGLVVLGRAGSRIWPVFGWMVVGLAGFLPRLVGFLLTRPHVLFVDKSQVLIALPSKFE